MIEWQRSLWELHFVKPHHLKDLYFQIPFHSFSLTVFLFFCWAYIDGEGSTSAVISVNGKYPSLFSSWTSNTTLHYLLYLVYHHWFHLKSLHYFFRNKIFRSTTLYVCLAQKFIFCFPLRWKGLQLYHQEGFILSV